MATIYVNKSGLDSNSGASAALAKLTIQAGITAAGSSGVVYVGSGLYNEKLSISFAGMTIYADGNVVLDGSGTAVELVTIGYGASATFIPYNNSGSWVFQNCPTATIVSGGGTGYYYNVNFISNSNNIAVGQATYTSLTCSYCVFTGFKTYAVYLSGSTPGSIFNCTFYNCTIGVLVASGATLTLSSCIFRDCSCNILGVTGSTLSYINTNVYYGHGLSTSSTTSNSIGTGSKTFTVPLSLKISANQVMKITDSSNSSNYMIGTVSSYAPASGTLVFSSGSISGSGTITNWTITVYPFGVNSIGYTNLTAFQATGFDANSIETDPQLVDAANNVFYPKAAFSNGSIIGAYPYSFVRGAGHNPDSSWDVSSTPNNTPAIWYNPGGNIAKNITTGFFELISGTSGVLYSPVYDVGSIQTITRINLGSNQVWPNAMIDTTTSDFAPNYQTIEIRASNSTFLQDASSPSWVEKKSDSTFTGISGRYVQIRLTFRTDDVGA